MEAEAIALTVACLTATDRADAAIAVPPAAVALAEATGLRLDRIDLLIELAKAHAAAGRADEAMRIARMTLDGAESQPEALLFATHPDCDCGAGAEAARALLHAGKNR